jgi:hypothetical protein
MAAAFLSDSAEAEEPDTLIGASFEGPAGCSGLPPSPWRNEHLAPYLHDSESFGFQNLHLMLLRPALPPLRDIRCFFWFF